MPDILFASNSISHWPNSVPSTAAGKFDSARVPYAIIVTEQQVLTSPVFREPTGDVTWVHFRFHAEDVDYAPDTTLIRGFDAEGELLFSMKKQFTTNDMKMDTYIYDGSGSAWAGQSINFSQDVISVIDIRYEATSSLLDLKLYVNGALAANASFGSNPSGFGKLAYFTLGAAFSTSTKNMYFSEFICADGDTRNGRLDLLRPVANGGETDWVGEATVLSDDDPTTGMTTILAGQRQTVSLTDYSGAANISAIVIASQSFAGDNGPQNMQHLIRMGGVNYESGTDIPLQEVLFFNLTNHEINPATSLAWIAADLTNIEIGFISKT